MKSGDRPQAGPRVEACILAGGLSSRMGRDKSRLRLGNRTLLAHAKAAARSAGLPVRIIRRDVVPRCGPLGGIYTALRSTQADAIVFLACDMPFVTSALLARIVDLYRDGGNAVFSGSERTGFPCLIPASAIKGVEELLASGNFAVQNLRKKLRARKLRLGRKQTALSFNVNTPAELNTARRLQKSTE